MPKVSMLLLFMIVKLEFSPTMDMCVGVNLIYILYILYVVDSNFRVCIYMYSEREPINSLKQCYYLDLQSF